MSLPESAPEPARLPVRGALPRIALLLALALPLAGCLKPAYGTLAQGGAEVSPKLKSITVDDLPDRFGHYLRNELAFELDGGAAGGPEKTLRLQISTKSTVVSAVVNTQTGRADTAQITLEAQWRLLPVGGGPTVATGRAYTNVSYDRSVQRFANVRAARDAEIRGARVLTDQIRTQLVAQFAGR